MRVSANKEAAEEIAALKQEVATLREELARLTPPLRDMLRMRGFVIYRMEPAEDLIIPSDEYIDRYYGLMSKYSFRLFMRDAIKHQGSFSVAETARYSTAEVTEDYIEHITEMGLAEPAGDERFRLTKRPVKSFGETLEWFVAETLRRELSAEALRGVKFRRPGVGGDYDVLAKVNGALLYIEVKSSPPKQVETSEIAAFLDRVEDLGPDAAVFFMDTELRMKDKVVPMFEEELTRRLGRPVELMRMERELFHRGDEIFIINSKGTVANNIEKLLRWHFRKHR